MDSIFSDKFFLCQSDGWGYNSNVRACYHTLLTEKLCNR